MRFELEPVSERSEMRFELKPVDEKPKRTLTKRNKYTPIIEGFLSGGHDLIRVEVANRNSNFMRLQLAKLIGSRGLEGVVKASVVNGELYLEKTG